VQGIYNLLIELYVVIDVNSNIMTIVDILRDITSGNSILKVAVDGDVKIAQESISAMSQGGI
jgi:hypothetical protein